MTDIVTFLSLGCSSASLSSKCPGDLPVAMGFGGKSKRCLLLLCIHLCRSASNYWTFVDQMEGFLNDAVSLHRMGKTAEAMKMLQKIRNSFQSAVHLEPSLPDAYVAFAQAMLTSNHLKESIDAWEKAIERMDNTQPAMLAWAQGRLRWARYGEVSMRRDALYAQGQGDLVESLKLVEEQLHIYPDFPSRHHDLATIRVMLSDYLGNSSNDQMAVESFRTAQSFSMQAWTAGLLERNRSQSREKGRIFYDWREATTSTALVSMNFLSLPCEQCATGTMGEAYVATFHDVGLSGDDGIIVDEERCEIFMASSGLAVNLANNLQLLETWGDPPTPNEQGPRFKWFDLGLGPNHGAWEKPMQVKQAGMLAKSLGIGLPGCTCQ